MPKKPTSLKRFVHYLICYLVPSIIFLAIALPLMCIETTACSGSYFLVNGTFTLFISPDPITNVPMYAVLNLVFFWTAFFLSAGLQLVELTFAPTFGQHLDSIRKMYDYPNWFIYLLFLLSMVVIGLYYIFVFVGTISNILFSLSTAAGIFISLAIGFGTVIIGELRYRPHTPQNDQDYRDHDA